ncbi:MAG: cytochrome c maturation protein CcmE [Armatimonadetes bacterium]|nr:cytochrome c maturation protein CcmE [Armatimonadota bacterium]
MNTKQLAGIGAGVAALAAIIFVFLSNASPYATVSEAKSMEGDNIHLYGSLVHESVVASPEARQVRFTIKDDKGESMNVIYHGFPPANMGEATEVVAVGGMKGENFESHKLLLKCPSKYEAERDKKLQARGS